MKIDQKKERLLLILGVCALDLGHGNDTSSKRLERVRHCARHDR